MQVCKLCFHQAANRLKYSTKEVHHVKTKAGKGVVHPCCTTHVKWNPQNICGN